MNTDKLLIMITFLGTAHHPIFCKRTTHFGGWICSHPPVKGTCSVGSAGGGLTPINRQQKYNTVRPYKPLMPGFIALFYVKCCLSGIIHVEC
jgi:hypothetical protein